MDRFFQRDYPSVMTLRGARIVVWPAKHVEQRRRVRNGAATQPRSTGRLAMSITETAKAFFAACEDGRGWEACSAYCAPDATFAAQAAPLADVRTLRDYTEWMKGLLTVLTDGRYEVVSFATDAERNNVCAYGVFTGTHLANGPCPPTGRTARTDYVYVMQFKDGRIQHMTKVWNSDFAFRQLGWA
jgi:ketosteroid isomerase-like protein